MGRLAQVMEPVADEAFMVYARLFSLRRPAGASATPQFRAMLLHDLLSAGDLRAPAHDMALFARHWGFRLDEIETPVIVWQGLADTIVPQSHGHHQAARLPRGELRVRPGRGPLRRVRRRRRPCSTGCARCGPWRRPRSSI